MARKKVKLALITNDSTRRMTFRKRNRGIMKKVGELSTLCGVQACMVMFALHERNPEAWPSLPEAKQLSLHFRSLPEMERSKKAINHEEFITKQAAKLQDQLRKQEKENRNLEMTVLMHEVLMGRTMHGVGIEDASSLSWMAEGVIKDLCKKIETAKEIAAKEAETAAASVISDGAIVPYEAINPMDTVGTHNWINPGENLISGGQELPNQPYMPPNSPWMDPSFPWY